MAVEPRGCVAMWRCGSVTAWPCDCVAVVVWPCAVGGKVGDRGRNRKGGIDGGMWYGEGHRLVWLVAILLTRGSGPDVKITSDTPRGQSPWPFAGGAQSAVSLDPSRVMCGSDGSVVGVRGRAGARGGG